jgi:hypothetical protein
MDLERCKKELAIDDKALDRLDIVYNTVCSAKDLMNDSITRIKRLISMVTREGYVVDSELELVTLLNNNITQIDETLKMIKCVACEYE